MTKPVVLTEKLRRPEPGGLPRRRLEERLLTPADSRLDLVVAPPGSGKTTLLARVAAATEAGGVPVAWYRITTDDVTVPSFVAHLARTLQVELGTDGDPPGITDVLESLDRRPATPSLVVFDDVHEIAGSAAERALDQFVQLRPRHLQVLLGSRRPPEMNIPRLRVSGQLREIGSDDLRFRSWEVEELFISIFREPLSPESAAALTRRTGGWAAGLQLFHLATSGRSALDRRRAVDDLGGRSKLVRSYLASNVLSELPEDRRHFLLRTCTLGTLTGPLCDSLLGITGSSTILDQLEHQQLFTSSDDDGQTFRYHEVLRTHLEWALVQEYGTAGAREWYSRSACLLESVGDLRAAVRAYARAEDWGAVGRLLQSRGTGPDAGATGTDLLLPPPWSSTIRGSRSRRPAAGSAKAPWRARSRASAAPRVCLTNQISVTTAGANDRWPRCGHRPTRPASDGPWTGAARPGTGRSRSGWPPAGWSRAGRRPRRPGPPTGSPAASSTCWPATCGAPAPSSSPCWPTAPPNPPTGCSPTSPRK